MEMAVFFVLAAVAVVAAAAVIVQRNAARSALFLLLNFCCLAGLYILLNAQFLALVQVIVYAGAIVILFLFIVMFLGVERLEERPERRWYHWMAPVLLAALLLAGLLWALIPAQAPVGAALGPDNARQLGAALLDEFSVPFELAALVLLAAIIGTVVLAKKRLEG